ncbi:unnamed protein product [Closterium sp. Naga37s-1]|nr:unnamed protein product [Closterium sp. Naga37s-1]
MASSKLLALGILLLVVASLATFAVADDDDDRPKRDRKRDGSGNRDQDRDRDRDRDGSCSKSGGCTGSGSGGRQKTGTGQQGDGSCSKSGGCTGSGGGSRQGSGRQGGSGAGGRGGGAGRTGSGAGAGAGRGGQLGGSNSAGKVRQGKKGSGNCSGSGSGSCNGGGGGSRRNAAAASIQSAMQSGGMQSAGYVVADNRERDRKRDGSGDQDRDRDRKRDGSGSGSSGSSGSRSSSCSRSGGCNGSGAGRQGSGQQQGRERGAGAGGAGGMSGGGGRQGAAGRTGAGAGKGAGAGLRGSGGGGGNCNGSGSGSGNCNGSGAGRKGSGGGGGGNCNGRMVGPLVVGDLGEEKQEGGVEFKSEAFGSFEIVRFLVCAVLFCLSQGTIVPEVEEDLWHAYNLIAPHDHVQSTTFRKVQKETGGGGSESERIKLRLEVAVEEVDFDASAHVIRVRGKNVTENEHVKLGSYHTLELDLQRAFTLTKDVWDSVAIDRLKEACDPSANADLAVVVMQEGLANVCLIGGSVTTVKARIETPIPRKRGPAIAGYDKAINKFFENVFQGVQRHIDFNVIRCLLIASPGFTKDQFFEYMMLEATRQNIRAIIENKAKIVLAHSTSGYKHAVKEVLALPAIMTQIKDTKAAKEVKALEDFYAMLSNDSARAFYGPGHVEAANERLAIHTLLISDDLFRNADVKTRRRYVDLVESVRANGGQVHVFSSLHVSGEQLVNLAGIAAILRFPLPELEDMEL